MKAAGVAGGKKTPKSVENSLFSKLLGVFLTPATPAAFILDKSQTSSWLCPYLLKRILNVQWKVPLGDRTRIAGLNSESVTSRLWPLANGELVRSAFIYKCERIAFKLGGQSPPPRGIAPPGVLNSSHYVTRGQRKLKKALCLPI